MAAIVYLDIDDEITSAAARLRALEERRIALVLPPGSRLATSRINFRLLAREAGARSKTLEIVTGDPSARALAASAGLPTHVSVAAFEAHSAAGTGGGSGSADAASPGEGPAAEVGGAPTASSAESPTIALTSVPTIAYPKAATPPAQVGRRPAPRTTGRGLALLLVVLVVLVAAGTAAYQLLPSATITLTPAVKVIGPMRLTVTAQPGITQPDPTDLLVPATTFTFDVEASANFPSTGLKVEEAGASGEVTFENCDTGGSVTVPDGAVVSTSDGVRFRTLDRVMMKRANLFPFSCDAGTSRVEAILPGLTGNVAVGSISKIPSGYDPIVLRVTNQSPTTGGTHTETKQVAQADVDAARVALDEQIVASFDAKVATAEGIPAGTTLFAETKVLGTSTLTVDPATLVGTDAESFDLGATARGAVIGADPSPVTTLADARIRRTVPDGFTLVEESVSIELGTPLVTGSTITFPVTARATAVRDVDIVALLAKVRGRGLPQARTVLGDYGEVTISVWPDWVTTIPDNESRVTFTVASPSATPDSSGSPAPTGSAGATP